MGSSADWQNLTYEESYRKELRGLRRRLESDRPCTINDLEGTLKHLYIMEGADWAGRGEVQNTALAAAIAAYESVIEELKAGPFRGNPPPELSS